MKKTIITTVLLILGLTTTFASNTMPFKDKLEAKYIITSENLGTETKYAPIVKIVATEFQSGNDDFNRLDDKAYGKKYHIFNQINVTPTTPAGYALVETIKWYATVKTPAVLPIINIPMTTPNTTIINNYYTATPTVQVVEKMVLPTIDEYNKMFAKATSTSATTVTTIASQASSTPTTTVIKTEILYSYRQTSIEISKIQRALKVKATGFYGDKTLKAVIQYQKANKLKVTGVVDQEMYRKLVK